MTELSEYQQLLRDAYRGEVLGAAFFATLAARQPDPDRREKLETLETVEARTATSLRRLAAGAGVLGGENTERANGEQLANSLDPENWHDFLSNLGGALPAFRANAERLRELAGSPVDPAITAYANHEAALERFVELELAGAGAKSLKPLHDHLRRPA